MLDFNIMRKMIWVVSFIGLITLTFVITCRVFDSKFADETIDYFAFVAGIFLAAEGVYKLITSRPQAICHIILRTLRVAVGTCIFTIHLLQFMRF